MQNAELKSSKKCNTLLLIIQSKQAQSTPDQNPTNNKNVRKKQKQKVQQTKRKKTHNLRARTRSKPGQSGPQRKSFQQQFFKNKKNNQPECGTPGYVWGLAKFKRKCLHPRMTVDGVN